MEQPFYIRSDITIDKVKPLYIDEKFTLSQIAEKFDCSAMTIRQRLIDKGFKCRRGGSKKGVNRKHIDMNRVIQLYYGEELNLRQIAKQLNCSGTLIGDRLDETGIERRPFGEIVSKATFKGTPIIRKDGYVHIYQPYHPKANNRGYVLEHILIAEKALGKFLPPQARTHHYNGIENKKAIVVCQDNPYHRLLHRRTNDLKRQRSNCKECDTTGIFCLKHGLCKGCYGKYKHQMYSQGLSLRTQ